MAQRNAVRIASSDNLNLGRFGCAFHNGTFSIDWKSKNASLATDAGIYACLGRVKTNFGPVVFLAFEISAVRPLPSYHYFPFNLNNPIHRAYLSRLAKHGDIRFKFLTKKRVHTRKHCMTPYLRSRASEILAEAVQQWEIARGTYDFDKALKLMERHLRIPALLNRLLVEDTVNELSNRIAEAVQTVPPENRELANVAANKVAEAFTQYYRRSRSEVLEFIRNAPQALTCITDFHRIFADNPTGLTEFLRDALAASFARDELERINELVTAFVAFVSLFRAGNASAESAPFASVPQLPAGLIDQVQSMKISGISKEAAIRFLDLIGMEVGGRPGRPTKDYSQEYELKASGLSWTRVARQVLRESSEFRKEFGERDFQSLTLEERGNLWRRIREGVRSYAKRTGKPFPIKGPTEK